jgi:hypothetical protein
MVNFGEERRTQRLQNIEFRLAIGLLVGAIGLSLVAWYRQPAQRANWERQEAPLISFSPRFEGEELKCDLHSSVRREVRVRQLIVMPGAPGAGPGPASATYGAMQAAYAQARAVRSEWEASGAFDALEQQFGNPNANARSMPPGLFRRGEALAAVERAAFCLPLHEISPPILAEDGFHIIEVLEAR